MNKILITVTTALFFFCASLQAQNLGLEIEYLFTVGEELEFGESGYLYNPVGVITDSHGNIIVADHQGRVLHIYNQSGKYLQSVGAPGRGPGEFSRITEIALDENDNLLVLDRFQFKVAKFNIETGSIEEFIYEDMPGMTNMTLAPLKNDKFATIYVDLGAPGNTDVNTKALRVYEFGEEEYISSHFQIFKYQFDKMIPIEENMGRGIGHKLTSVDGNRVAAGHRVYKGKLFLINTNSGDVIIAENPNVGAPFYVEYDVDSISEMQGINGLVSSSGRGGNYKYQILYYSMLLDANKNYLYHIYRQNEKEAETIGDYVELYSLDGTFIDQFSLSEHLEYGEDVRLYYSHIDNENRLFVRRYFDDRDPDVRVYSLNINQDE